MIQGPPGTGKSTTIAEIVKHKCLRTPEARAYGPILVTAARNKALDSIAEKLLDMKILVFGTDSRIGACSKRHTLEALVRDHCEVKAARDALQLAEYKVDEMQRLFKLGMVRAGLFFLFSLLLGS